MPYVPDATLLARVKAVDGQVAHHKNRVRHHRAELRFLSRELDSLSAEARRRGLIGPTTPPSGAEGKDLHGHREHARH